MPGNVSDKILTAINEGDHTAAIALYHASCHDTATCPFSGRQSFCGIQCLKSRLQYLSLLRRHPKFQSAEAAYASWSDKQLPNAA